MKSSTSTQLNGIVASGLRLVLITAVVLSLGAAASAVAGGHHRRGPHIYPPHSKPFGKSYPEWQAAFWSWALSLPVEGHPFIDSPDFDFSAGQSGKVWFVGAPDPYVSRKAVIPEGTALFLTVRDVETSSLELPPFFGATEEEQRANSNWFADHIVDLYCIIDGVPVRNLEAYRFESPQFEFDAPTPWIWGDPENNVGGEGTGVGDGYFVMVDSFSVGKHTIRFGGTFHFEPGELVDEALDLPHDVIIELTVVRQGHHHNDDDDGCPRR
jgi:hypothetical protein